VIRIIPQKKPLNHVRLTLFYLLLIYLSLMFNVNAEPTTKITQTQRIEYVDHLYEKWLHHQILFRRLYGTTQGETKETPLNARQNVPNAVPPSPYSQVTTRR
jgi:hypothetical protein